MIDHATYKTIKHYNRERMDNFCKRLSKAGFEKGIRAGSMALYTALHEQFGWGNTRIERLFDEQAVILDEMMRSGNPTEFINQLQQTLLERKIECLKDTGGEVEINHN